MTNKPGRKWGWREWLAKALMGAGVVVLFCSLPAPYWRIRVTAPQYPKGLTMIIYLDHLGGDVGEIDILNHYIGMRKSGEAAKIERKISVPSMIAIAILTLFAIWIRSRWSFFLALPALLFPAIFTADLFWWLRDSGLNLNPKAPLSTSVKPFIPPLFGRGKIAQFMAEAKFEQGFYFSVTAAGLILLALLFRFWQRKRDSQRSLTLLVVALLLLGSTVNALAQTLTVSPEGPFKKIEEAVSAAAPGDTLVVQKGVYRGPFKIEKSLRLLGEGLPILDGNGKGTVILLTAPDTVFKGFKVINSGDYLSSDDAGLRVSGAGALIENNVFENVLFGIDLKNSPRTVVRNNTLNGKALDQARRGDLIRVWYSHDTVVESNRTQNGRDAVLWYSKNTLVKGNHFEGGRYGLHFMYCNDSVVENNTLARNSVGAYLMYSARISMRDNFVLSNRGPSGYGIGFKDMADADIRKNLVSDNRVAFFLDGVTGNFENNVLAYNDTGIAMLPTARGNRLHGNSFIDNGEQVTIEGMGQPMGNDWRGNFWSDYRGYDANRDGKGDTAYHAIHFFERLTDRYPTLKIFNGNPSSQALDFASKIFPVFSPQAAFMDPEPAMRPFQLTAPGKRALSWPWIFMSGSLLLPSLGLWFRRDSGASAAFPGGVSPSRKPEQAGQENTVAIRVENLKKEFGKIQALKSVSFTVKRGETVVLWGPNGAGKTTALRCLLGIFPFEGRLEVLGLDVATQGKEARKQIGYVPQEIRMHTDQSVHETVAFYARLRKIHQQEADALINRWSLAEARNKKVNDLSGGMKQKLALVIALLSDPPVLFLDESTNHLDLNTRYEFMSLLSSLKTAGKTLVFCSHRHSEIWKLADRVIVLKEGQKIDEGTPEAVKKHLGGPTLLSLTVKAEHGVPAADLLKKRGFRTEQNGSQLLIEAPSDRKAEPFTLLKEAAIPVLDFDLEHDSASREEGQNHGS